ncbi:PAS domain S-box protein [Nostoc sp. HG1]|nr:PAS domain S-box protein [Nostoc sp. HG1]
MIFTIASRQKLKINVYWIMLNHSSDAIIVRDMNEKISHWNQGAERLYGWTREEVKDQCIHTFIKKTFPKPKEEIIAEYYSKVIGKEKCNISPMRAN